jgi:hypothetical protein
LDDIIQLSASTYIDNSVCHFTEHQIEKLRGIAGLQNFNGILEPDFTKSRTSGPFVCTWLAGTRRHQLVIGKYRTLPWPQKGQLSQLRAGQLTCWKPKIFGAISQFGFKDCSNDPEYLKRMFAEDWKLLQALWNDEVPDAKDFAMTEQAHKLARNLLILGNLKFAEEFHTVMDKKSESSNES